jgi:starch-binding outer membrane protein, SusD/RagB family
MRIIKTTIVFALVAVLISACNGFLDSIPLTSKTDATYYTTPAEAEEALTGCYDALQQISGLTLIVGPETLSDLCFSGEGISDDAVLPALDEFSPSEASSYTSMFEDSWKALYKGVYRCNVLISKIDQIDWTNNESKKPLILSEARFLRAYFYYSLVQCFENVPLITVPTDASVSQAAPDETYAQIASDLIYAIENGDATKYSNIASTDFGHANKWAAEAMLARVYLYYTGYYQKSDLVGVVSQSQALTYLEDVITNSGYGLLDNYYDIWPAPARYKAVVDGGSLDVNTYAGETSKEILFSVRYTYTGDYTGTTDDPNTDGPDWQDNIGMRNQYYGKYGYASGWGIASVVPKFYNSFKSKDVRKAASIIAVSEEGVTYTKYADMRDYTGYFIKKYTPMCDEDGNYLSNELSGNTNFQINQYVDFLVMRYSDVLLMAAELGSEHALDYFNLVHKRAGLDAVESIDKDAIFDERKFEFAFEGLRYWDLLRYDGKTNLNYAAAATTTSTTVKTGGVSTSKVIDGTKIKNFYGLFQIPQNQITLSGGVLKQNTGWDL